MTAVAAREDIDELARRVSSRGYSEAAVTDTAQAALLVLRDPDRVQIEVCYWKPSDPD